MSDEGDSTPEPAERRPRSDLRRRSQTQLDVIYGHRRSDARSIFGMLPRNDVAAQLRALEREARIAEGDVPRGAADSAGRGALLAALACIALAVVALAIAIPWLLVRAGI